MGNFESSEILAQKSNLTKKDVILLSKLVEKDMAKHAKRMLKKNGSC